MVLAGEQACGLFLYVCCILSTKEKLKFIGKFFLRVGIKGDARTF